MQAGGEGRERYSKTGVLREKERVRQTEKSETEEEKERTSVSVPE